MADVGPQGARVIDRGQVHQDHAVAIRGVCASLVTAQDLGPLDAAIVALNLAAPAPSSAMTARIYGGSHSIIRLAAVDSTC